MRLFVHPVRAALVTDERIAALTLYPERRRGVHAELVTNAPRTVEAAGALTRPGGNPDEQHR